jgi:hypothetical protein
MRTFIFEIQEGTSTYHICNIDVAFLADFHPLFLRRMPEKVR